MHGKNILTSVFKAVFLLVFVVMAASPGLLLLYHYASEHRDERLQTAVVHHLSDLLTRLLTKLDSLAELLDKDECKAKTTTCWEHSECVNTLGSYQCSCIHGNLARPDGSNDTLCHGYFPSIKSVMRKNHTLLTLAEEIRKLARNHTTLPLLQLIYETVLVKNGGTVPSAKIASKPVHISDVSNGIPFIFILIVIGNGTARLVWMSEYEIYTTPAANCYKANPANKLLFTTKESLKPGHVSNAQCWRQCRDSGWKVSATSQGHICYCGNGYPTDLTDRGKCDAPCKGNNGHRETCGGFSGYYQLEKEDEVSYSLPTLARGKHTIWGIAFKRPHGLKKVRDVLDPSKNRSKIFHHASEDLQLVGFIDFSTVKP